MNSALGKIFDTIIDAINLFRFWIVIDAFEQGIILRLGKFHKKVAPGFHFRLPFNIDRLLWLNIRKKTRDSWEMTLTTKDGKVITLSFDMVVRVIDAQKALLNVDQWLYVTHTTAKIILSQLVEATNLNDIMTPKFSENVKNTINVIVDTFGVEVTDYGLTEKATSPAFRLFNGAGRG
jgi:regulator of protease activity HflC (stomatin/prohibitin superfamily)